MNAAAGYQTTKEQFISKRLPNHILNKTLHRTCAHLRIKSLARKESPQRFGKTDFHLLLLKLLFQCNQELIHHPHDDVGIERLKRDDGIETIAKLRREHPFDVLHLIARLARV